MTVQITTDGSGGARGPGGWAAVLRWGGQVKEISGGADEATNNTMELMAAIMALHALKKPCGVELTTDSEYLANGACIWLPIWKRNHWRTKSGDEVRNRQYWEILDRLLSRHRVEWIWVKGHSGHVDNERADQLAGVARLRRKAELELLRSQVERVQESQREAA